MHARVGSLLQGEELMTCLEQSGEPGKFMCALDAIAAWASALLRRAPQSKGGCNQALKVAKEVLPELCGKAHNWLPSSEVGRVGCHQRIRHSMCRPMGTGIDL
jgi:hypothetical protein